MWDVFISHAAEDKAEVAEPLCEALEDLGLRVWLDSHELTVGDSIREKIEEGLRNSRYGIVVLSPIFFQKAWAMQELSALFALEERGRKSILPIWHNIDRETVVKKFPLLADRVAANTRQEIWDVARLVARAIVPERAEQESMAHYLHNLLDRPFDAVALRTSLVRENSLLRWVENWGPEIQGDVWGPKTIHDFTADICMLANFHYQYFHQVTFIVLLPFQVQIFADEEGVVKTGPEDDTGVAVLGTSLQT
jgi:hypothetical protein